MSHRWMAAAFGSIALAVACDSAPSEHARDDASADTSSDAAPDGSPDSTSEDSGVPSCAYVDGSQHPAILGLAANLGGGQSLATAMSNNNVPGLSVAIRDVDGVIYTAVFGIANNQSFDGAAPALSPTTLFQAASISKAVSALAYLLSDLPATTMNTDIRPQVASFITPPYAMTPADLLSHSAGTAPHNFDGSYLDTAPLPTEIQLLLGTSPSISAPLTYDNTIVGMFAYSGGGYTLWQTWLEAVSGHSLGEFVHDHLFVAAGATRSRFTQPLLFATDHDAACGTSTYLTQNSLCRLANPSRVAAGLWTTPAELVCMTQLVTQHHADVLTTVRSRALDVDFDNGTYPQVMGIGLFHRPANGVDESAGHFYEHSGVNEGFRSQMVFFDDGRAIVAMDNGYANNGGISGFAVRALCRELSWPCTANDVGP